MSKIFLSTLTGIFLVFALIFSRTSDATLINFEGEGLTDSTPITSQYTGLTFSNATVITAGSSLNEFEFPPKSFDNVVFDDTGGIAIDFTTPVADFGAYFTYSVPLSLSFFDAGNNSLGTLASSFLSNLALSGVAGSSPNEFIQFVSAGISRVVIQGDPAGISFTMDDLSFEPSSTAVPEPSTALLLIGGLLSLGGLGLGRFRRR